jgi:hypothetical protein
MTARFAPAALNSVFLAHVDGADLYALEYAPDGVFAGYYVRRTPTGGRTMFRINSTVREQSSLPEWVRKADDLYSVYRDIIWNANLSADAVTSVFLTYFEGARIYAVEYAPDGVFTGFYIRQALTGKRTMFDINSAEGERSSLPEWVRLADDLYSEYLDSRFREDMAS